MTSPDRIDRRHFAAQLAWGATGLTAAMTPLATTLAAEDKPAPDKTDSEGKPAEKRPEEPADARQPPPAEVLLLTYLTRRHPSEHFDEESLPGIYRDIRGDVARGKQLSEFPLKNSDEPAFVFAASRHQIQDFEQKGTKETK